MNPLKCPLAMLVAAHAFAQAVAADLGYSADQNQCLVANSDPRPNEHLTWTGACKAGYADGWGILEFRQGSTMLQRFEGHLSAGHFNGKGILSTPGRERIEGVWSGGVLVEGGNGPAKVETYPDGARYDGQFKGTLRHGYGEMVYAGGWRNDRWDGSGIAVYADGDRYEGELKNGQRHGKGSLTSAKGNRYEGDWKNDMAHGKGMLVYADGGRYEGEWKHGLFDGAGTYLRANGDRTVGEFKRGRLDGRAKVHLGSGIEYEGTWKAGELDGACAIRMRNLYTYVGACKRGVLHGKGVLNMGNGTHIEADFEDGRPKLPLPLMPELMRGA